LSTQAPESAGEVQTAGARADPAVRLVSLHKRYGRVDAVGGVDLDVGDGELFTLLGPSGSGKTSLLRLIAGFERPDAGRVELGGEDVTFRPPYARDVNTVFQDYALFPHMTVAENIAYGLRVKRVPRARRRERVERALATVRLDGHGDRRPAQLSGGQRQRVALARAIVNQPKVLLLDEPLGALDLKLRQEMQLELKRIQEQVGITFLYVTHDQEEALTMSDRVAILRDGRIEQVGTPVEVYERPASDFVAGFIGVSNLIERDGRHVTVRPEKIRILDDDQPAEPGAHVERGTIREVVYLGAVTRYVVDLEAAGELVVVRQNLESAEEALDARDRRVRLAWRPEQAFPIERGHQRGHEQGVEQRGEDRAEGGEEA
jgi:putative spermidine/putrescine transport system ATP-binding protein